VTYTSSNPAVASISGNKITPHAAGDVVITGVVTGTTVSGTLGFSVLERFGNLAGRPFGVAYLGGPSPEFLVTELDVEALAVLNASSYASLASVPTSATPTDIAINSQGTIAYVTGENGPNITVVALPAGTSQQTFSEAGSARLLLSPDGSRLYVGKTGGFDVLSTSTGAVIAGFATGGQINGMAMSPDGSTLWLSNDFTGKVYRVNAATGTVTDSAAASGTPQEVAYHAASGTLYVANEGGWVDVLDGAHLGTVRRIGNVPGAFGMRLTADGTKLVVAGSLYGSVYVVDRANGVVTKTVTVGGTPRRIALLPDGRVAIANEAGYVTLLTP
jgi:YVTN family beta-propeller protein